MNFFLNQTYILAKFGEFRCFFHFGHLQEKIQNCRPFSPSRFFHSYDFPEYWLCPPTFHYLVLALREIIARKVESPCATEEWHLEFSQLYFDLLITETGLAQWRERSSPANIAWVRFQPGAICGLLLLLVAPRVFLRVLRFSSLHKNQHLQIPTRARERTHLLL